MSVSFSHNIIAVQLENGCILVPAAKPSQRSGADLLPPKKVAVRMWKLLPDEAVFNVIWQEEGREFLSHG